MCKGNKKCKACNAAQIGSTMKKTRKSGKNIAMDVAYYAGGAIAAGYVVPKVVEMVAPSGQMDPKLINGGSLVLSVIGAMNTKGDVQKLLVGAATGSAVALANDLMAGSLGYVISPSYDVNRVFGTEPGGQYAGTTGSNPGAL